MAESTFPWGALVGTMAGLGVGLLLGRTVFAPSPAAPPSPSPSPSTLPGTAPPALTPGAPPAASLPTPAPAPSTPLPVAPQYQLGPIAPTGVYAGSQHCSEETPESQLQSLEAATRSGVAQLPQQTPTWLGQLLTAEESAILADRKLLGFCPTSAGIPRRIRNSASYATAIRAEMANRGLPAPPWPVV